MRAQIRGLDQASRNAADGISLIQTAEGALNTVNDILIRIRELVVQAANDTNVGGDGGEAVQGDTVNDHAGQGSETGTAGGAHEGTDRTSDRLRIQDEIDQLMEEINNIAARTEFNTRTLLDGSLATGAIGEGTWGEPGQGWGIEQNATTGLPGAEMEQITESNRLWFHTGANSHQGMWVTINSVSTAALFNTTHNHHQSTTNGMWHRIINVMDIGGYDVQMGTHENDWSGTELGNQGYGEGSPGGVHHSPVRVGQTLIEAVDSALAHTTRQRSLLGAIQNRLEFNIENLDIASENLQAADSRIRDADMAREMMRFTMANVLQQSSISMLAQANQLPNNLLTLLR
jgi:flagellin